MKNISHRKKNVIIVSLILCIFLIGAIIYFVTPQILQKISNSDIDEALITLENHDNIFIDSNNMFTTKASSEGWDGNGTLGNPFIIENYKISPSLEENGIEIRNTNLYFIIRNVIVNNGMSNYKHGFYFNNITNGELINNTANKNLVGFLLKDSTNNILKSNIAEENLHGFRIWYSSNNSLINNTANENLEYGIYLDNSNYNIISKNLLLGNGVSSFYEKNCIENEISDNLCSSELFFLYSNADEFDQDGTFTLTWTAWENADNYTLYQNSVIIAEGLNVTTYNIINLTNGIYVFYIKAIGEDGKVYSNTIKVIVNYFFYIDGNADFHQTAVVKSLIGNGTYSNPYIIKNYEIIAAKRNGIHIQNTDIYFIIRNVTVINGSINNNFGIYLKNVTNGVLENNTVINNQYGILLKDSYNNTLERNVAINNIHGLSIDSSYQNTLTGNNVMNNTYFGFYICSSNNNNLTGNTAMGNLNGFILSSSNNTKLINNIANNNKYGFFLSSSNNNILADNTANNNLKYGIYLQESYFNEILGNILEDNGIGPIYENVGEKKDFPDIFLIVAIVFVIIVLSFISIKSMIFIKKKMSDNLPLNLL